MEYGIHLAILVSLYLLLAHSFNLSFGLGHLLNLAHVSSYAIGAYVTALLSTEMADSFWGSFWACIPLSVIISGLFALFISAISRRLNEEYFAIGTLAFSAVVTALLINWKSLTRGVLGIAAIPRPVLFDINFQENRNYLAFVAVFMLLGVGFIGYLGKTPFVRALRAQAEDEPASFSLGVDTLRVRTWALIISSAVAGLSGALFAYFMSFIDPTSFMLGEMVFVLSIVICGKPGSFWGVTAATFFLVLLPEPLRFLNLSASVLGPLRQLLYSLILFLVVYWKRKTLAGQRRTV